MKRDRATKILATLGPASSSAGAIARLFEAGADVFRVNFSHGSWQEHRARVEAIRRVEAATGRPVGILMDLQGPKLRIGRFAAGGIKLGEGQRFRFDLDPTPGDETRVCLPHPEIFAAVAAGEAFLLDDGKVQVDILQAGPERLETLVRRAGPLSDHKGVNVPSAALPLAALSEKDRRDLEFGLELGVDWVALSFVQRPEDVAEARRLIDGRAWLMAKIEKPLALSYIDEIIELADGIMVARGDLGVELAPEEVPGRQKEIIRKCRLAGKPVVVATQMLDSMVQQPTPTRAEASDVAGAVYDGADAVMLSAESAVGRFPVEAVAVMNRIIARTEREAHYRQILHALHPEPVGSIGDAIAAAATEVARSVEATTIVSFTSSGQTTLRVARDRPDVPVLGLTPSEAVARRLALVWGTHSVVTPDVSSFDEMAARASSVALREGFAGPGDKIAITVGVPFGTPGSTNVLRVCRAVETAARSAAPAPAGAALSAFLLQLRRRPGDHVSAIECR